VSQVYLSVPDQWMKSGRGRCGRYASVR
jgi:hypothetical protein